MFTHRLAMPDREELHRWVRVSSRVERDNDGEPCEVTIEVSDNGIGVPLEQRDRLFQRLFRATNAESAGVEGTGLGLSIVRETIEAVGGHVSVSFTGKGSVFAFSLPCRVMHPSHPSPRSTRVGLLQATHPT